MLEFEAKVTLIGAGNLFTQLSIFQSSLVLILTPTLYWRTGNKSHSLEESFAYTKNY